MIRLSGDRTGSGKTETYEIVCFNARYAAH